MAEKLGSDKEMIGERPRRASEGLAVFCSFAWEVAANTSYIKKVHKNISHQKGEEKRKKRKMRGNGKRRGRGLRGRREEDREGRKSKEEGGEERGKRRG